MSVFSGAVIPKNGNAPEEETLIHNTLFNLACWIAITIFLAICGALFAGYVWFAFAISEYVKEYTNSSFLSFVATISYVMLVLVGIPVTWVTFKKWRENEKAKP